MSGLYFEEYTEGWSFRSGGQTVSAGMVDSFIELCSFTSPTFSDREYVERQYSGRMVPGLLVLSLAEGLVLDAGLTRRRGIFLMELTPKFLRPVYAEDTIFNHASLQSKRLTSKTDRGVVITRHDVLNQKGDLVIRYDSTRMIRTRAYVEADGSAADRDAGV